MFENPLNASTLINHPDLWSHSAPFSRNPMAKANASAIETPMPSKSSKKPAQPPKSTGKQTTLFGFFSRAGAAPNTPAPKRVEARPTLPPTPLASSEIEDDGSPIRVPVQKSGTENGLRTPVTPMPKAMPMEMDVDDDMGSSGSRTVSKSACRC
jgi:hypothetical protein